FIILFFKFFELTDWAYFKFHIRELTAAAGLFFIGLAMLNRRGNGFTVRYLRFTYVCFNFKFSFKPVHNNFEMKLAHSCNRSLSGFFIRGNLKSWIFFRQLNKPGSQFFSVCL